MSGRAESVLEDGLSELRNADEDSKRQGILAVGIIIGAIAASSCCILPLALTVVGVSGAWMANLRALAPYQPVIITLTIAVLGYSFYLVYLKPKKACSDGACSQPIVPGRTVKASLWVATVIVALAASFALWFPLILPYLP